MSVLTTDQLEVGKYYLGKGDSQAGFGSVYYITGMNGDENHPRVIGFRVDSEGGTCEGVAPAGRGKWIEIDEEGFRTQATINYNRKLDRVIAGLEIDE